MGGSQSSPSKAKGEASWQLPKIWALAQQPMCQSAPVWLASKGWPEVVAHHAVWRPRRPVGRVNNIASLPDFLSQALGRLWPRLRLLGRPILQAAPNWLLAASLRDQKAPR